MNPWPKPPVFTRRRAGLAAVGWAGLGLLGCGERPLPAETAYTLLDGRRSSLGDLRGQVVLVNFWATTCAVCMAEMPELVALHQRLAPQGLRTVAVAMRYDPPARVAQVAESRQLPFDVVIDNLGTVAQAFPGVEATPTSFVLDRQGRVVWRHEGRPDFAALQARLQGLLAAA